MSGNIHCDSVDAILKWSGTNRDQRKRTNEIKRRHMHNAEYDIYTLFALWASRLRKKTPNKQRKYLCLRLLLFSFFWGHLTVDLPSRFRIFCMLRHTNSIITICKTIEIVLNFNAHFSAHVHKRVDDVQNPNIKRPQYMKCYSTQFRWHCITLGHTIHFFYSSLFDDCNNRTQMCKILLIKPAQTHTIALAEYSWHNRLSAA